MCTFDSPDECEAVLLLYYDYLGTTYQVMSSIVPLNRMCRQLTVNMPWTTGARLPPPPPTLKNVPTNAQDATIARDTLLQHAKATYHEPSQRALQRGLGPPHALHQPLRKRRWKVPSTTASQNKKSIPVKPTREVATREVFSHAGQPLNSQFKQASRMTSLLEKRYTCSFFTLNVLNQQHLVEGFLQPARQYFQQLGVAVGGGG